MIIMWTKPIDASQKLIQVGIVLKDSSVGFTIKCRAYVHLSKGDSGKNSENISTTL